VRLSDGRRHSLTSNSSTSRKKRRKADLHLQIQEIKNLETTSSSEEEVDQEVVVETEENATIWEVTMIHDTIWPAK
jgi:hypothetical protein